MKIGFIFIFHLTIGILLKRIGKEDLESHSNAVLTIRAVFHCPLGLNS